jgi:hypothetical protein
MFGIDQDMQETKRIHFHIEALNSHLVGTRFAISVCLQSLTSTLIRVEKMRSLITCTV